MSSTHASPVASPPRPRRRLARSCVLVAVFVCAACGLVYELALVALGSYLIGDAVGQASIVVSLMVFAMGIGALVAKPLQHHAAPAFAAIEILLALLGGLSVFALYAVFAWWSLYLPGMIIITLVLGTLIGAEIPLLMVLLQRIRRQDAGSAVADMFAADYVGALLGGLAFPFLLLPLFGQLHGVLLAGAVNAVAGLGLVLAVFGRELTAVTRWVLIGCGLGVGVLLGTAALLASAFEDSARQALYRAPIVHAERSDYQEIVLTESTTASGAPDFRLFLDGALKFSSLDQRPHDRALTCPALAGPHRDVLILGGGDGLALREVLRHPGVERVTVVDLDPRVIQLSRTDPRLRALNAESLDDPRVRVDNADAFAWLRDNQHRYDVVFADLPAPQGTATAKLYSGEFYGLLRHSLAPRAEVALRLDPPEVRAHAFACVRATMADAGLSTTPYAAVDAPNSAFLLGRVGAPPALPDTSAVHGLRPTPVSDVRPSSLLHPTVLDHVDHPE